MLEGRHQRRVGGHGLETAGGLIVANSRKTGVNVPSLQGKPTGELVQIALSWAGVEH